VFHFYVLLGYSSSDDFNTTDILLLIYFYKNLNILFNYSNIFYKFYLKEKIFQFNY